MTVYDTGFDSDVESMDFEHTNLEAGPSIHDLRSQQESMYKPFTTGPFAVPDSFFERPYARIQTEANKVSDWLNGISLAKEEEQGEATTPDLSNSPNSSSDESPTEERNSLVLYESASRSRQGSFDSQRRSSSVNPNNIPTTPTNLPASPVFGNARGLNDSSYSPTFHQHQYQGAPTYDNRVFTYYPPQPIVPMIQTEAKIRVAAHIFGLTVKGIAYAVLAYIGYYLLFNFHLDVEDKINFFETLSLSTRNECNRHYETSKCELGKYPALAEKCVEWERCIMSPLSSNRSRAIAEVFAQVVNGLADMTPKAMAILFVGTYLIAWMVVNVLSARKVQQPQITPPSPPTPPLPTSNSRRLNIEPLPQL